MVQLLEHVHRTLSPYAFSKCITFIGVKKVEIFARMRHRFPVRQGRLSGGIAPCSNAGETGGRMVWMAVLRVNEKALYASVV